MSNTVIVLVTAIIFLGSIGVTQMVFAGTPTCDRDGTFGDFPGGAETDLGFFDSDCTEVSLTVDYDPNAGPMRKFWSHFPETPDPFTIIETITNVGTEDITDWHEEAYSREGNLIPWVSASTDVASTISGVGTGVLDIVFDVPVRPGETFTVTKVVDVPAHTGSSFISVLQWPTNENLALDPNNPLGVTNVGDFKCYMHDNNRIIDEPVVLHDQFIEDASTVVGQYRLFCNSADKDSFLSPFGSTDSMSHHLKCWDIDPIDIPDILVDVNTPQFGLFEDVNVLQAVELCTPAAKVWSQGNLRSLLNQHWLCYEIDPIPFSGQVGLRDQFLTSDETILDAVRLCNPVSKERLGEERTPVPLPDQHLFAFAIDSSDEFSTGGRQTHDQFGRHDISTTTEYTLFVEATKTISEDSADLSVIKSDDVDPIVAGNTLTYTIRVDNAGPDTATNVVATEILPAGVTFVKTTGCTNDPNGVPACNLGNIPANAFVQYTVEVTVDAGTNGIITNQVSVSSDTMDPDNSNNSDPEDTTVNQPQQQCPPGTVGTPPNCTPIDGQPVGGTLISLDTTSLLVGTQYTAAWLIPVIVAGIGFAIVIARKY